MSYSKTHLVTFATTFAGWRLLTNGTIVWPWFLHILTHILTLNFVRRTHTNQRYDKL